MGNWLWVVKAHKHSQEKRVETEPFHEEEICRMSEMQEMVSDVSYEWIAETEGMGTFICC